MHIHTHSHDETENHRGVNWFALWQAILIGATGMMLLVKVLTGVLPFYVHVKYTPLIAGTGLLLLLLALLHGWNTLTGTRAHEHEAQAGHAHGIQRWSSPAMLALLLPILLGLLVPARALGTAALSTRGFGGGADGMRTVQSIAGGAPVGIPDATQWTLLDWVNALLYEPDNPHLQGQTIETVGFVWHRGGQPGEYFVVSRFVVSCCTADSLAVGMPVHWPDSASLSNDQWVRVVGTIGLAEIDGQQEAIIEASEVIPGEQPAEPYLYP